MTFSKAVKYEILKNEIKREDRPSFLKGLLISSSKLVNNFYSINYHDNEYKEIVLSIFDKFNIKYEIKSKAIIFSEEQVTFSLSEDDFGRAFYSGLFFGGGSISNPESKYYHLEIKIILEKYLKKIINFSEIDFKINNSENKSKIYLKKSDEISNFLKIINANESLFEFENERIKRDFRNNLNRISSFEFYNQQKTTSAFNRHNEYIEKIYEKNLINSFSENEKIFIKERRKHPELSLKEISELLEKKYNIKKTKSALNHWVIKIKKIANSN
ncbi:MAG: DNA-binding protein WhiA [Mycoplasma sp.]|nr:DNA-binding protein WhiA [Mycoplasma sp.]